jgi:hypothetical protein
MRIDAQELRYRLDNLKDRLATVEKRTLYIVGGGGVLGLGLLIVLVVIWWPSGGPPKVEHSPADYTAAKAVATLVREIKDEERFAGVRIFSGPADVRHPDGSIMVMGRVPTQPDSDDLKKIVTDILAKKASGVDLNWTVYAEEAGEEKPDEPPPPSDG